MARSPRGHSDRFLTRAALHRRAKLAANLNSMRKQPAKTINNGLREKYDLSRLKGGVRGKYYRQAIAGTNLVLIDPDLANLFPDSASVNRALRLLAEAAGAATTKTKPRRR
jgi:hypothetical protein